MRTLLVVGAVVLVCTSRNARGAGDAAENLALIDKPLAATAATVPGALPVKKSCRSHSGFGLSLPAVSVRFRDFRHGSTHELNVDGAASPDATTIDLRGPVAGGIGAGYYAACACWEGVGSLGFNFFAFSQGLDLSNKSFQFGTGLGFQVEVKERFRAGLDIGYDLIRVETLNGVSQANGFFAFQGMGGRSLTFMFTLTAVFPSDDEPKVAKPPTPASAEGKPPATPPESLPPDSLNRRSTPSRRLGPQGIAAGADEQSTETAP